MLCSFWKFFLLSLIFLAALPATAVRPFQPRDEEGVPIRTPVVRSSGYIFSGTVKAVERVAPQSKSGVAVMRITFRVEQGFRGAHSGQMLTIREWAGLWEGGERYRPGERVMLFLYPPSKLGLTSPVGGGAGSFRVDRDGNVVVGPSRPGHPGSGGGRLFPAGRIPPRKLFSTLRDMELE